MARRFVDPPRVPTARVSALARSPARLRLMATRKRCSECRKTFTSAPTARSAQRVCSASCRAARDRKLQRARRRRDLDGYREDERRRQQEHRERRRSADGGHAPPSERKHLKIKPKIAKIVDRRLKSLRLTLIRDLLEMTPKLSSKLAKHGDCHAPPSPS